MSRKPLFWILALTLAGATAVVQRMTGPTYPVSGRTTMRGKPLSYVLERSHGGDSDAMVRIPLRDSSIHAELEWRRYKTEDPWHRVSMRMDSAGVEGEIPHQPPGGKVLYRVRLDDGVESISLPEKDPVIMRFKGEVPLWALLPHILAMFGAMFLSARAGFECFSPEPSYKRLVHWTIGLMVVGGFILGPLVQYYAFHAWWTGWPFGDDLTDNKTAVAMLAWICAAVALRRGWHGRRWVLSASLITFVIFLVPHSLFGTELDCNAKVEKRTVTADIAENVAEFKQFRP